MLETETKRVTIKDIVSDAALELRASAVKEPLNEARALVAASLNLKRQQLVLDADRLIDGPSHQKVLTALARRKKREPLSRIVGTRDFYGRSFLINESVLDPRPDTETLILAALEIVEQEGWHDQPIRVLDIGTGSGCIIITLLKELPHAQGCATDICSAALTTAEQNAKIHEVSDRLEFVQGDGLEPVEGSFNLVVSNPPYIPSNDIDDLEPEVSLFDPRHALDGGPDGLIVYRQILMSLNKALQNGWFIAELGEGQAEKVARLLGHSVGTKLRSWQDLNGRTRCVAARTQ